MTEQTLQNPEVGKYVRAITKRSATGEAVNWLSGKIREIRREGQNLVLESGWNINLDHGDELIWCADTKCPNFWS